MAELQPGAKSDIWAEELPPLDWSPAKRAASLETLFRWCEGRAVNSANWYVVNKKAKANWSKALRVTAVLFLIAGGAIPVIALATDDGIKSEWGFLALALGAGVVLLDRSFGYSSSWTRYMTTATRIQRRVTKFQAEWSAQTALLGDSVADDLLLGSIKLAREFLDDFRAIVEAETEQWATEFDSQLRELQGLLPTSPRQR